MSSTINPNKALWEKGDFTRIAASDARERRGAGRPDRHQQGHGRARPRLRRRHHRHPRGAARRRRARRRHRPEPGGGRQRGARSDAGLTNLRFQEGDASDLEDLDDDRFDLVVSIFGAMFAPRPVRRGQGDGAGDPPGGRIVMGNWIPGDPTLVAQILKISAAYSPPPPEGFVSPMTWGVEDARGRALHRRRRAGRRASPASATPTRSTSRARRPSSSASSATTTARR